MERPSSSHSHAERSDFTNRISLFTNDISLWANRISFSQPKRHF